MDSSRGAHARVSVNGNLSFAATGTPKTAKWEIACRTAAERIALERIAPGAQIAVRTQA